MNHPSPRIASLLALGLVTVTANAQRSGTDWPQFRGIEAIGFADEHPVPTEWDVPSGENVAWKTAVPGLSHASPIVWGDKVFVVTGVATGIEPELRVGLYGAGDSAEDMVEHGFHLICLDRNTGKILWNETAVETTPKFARHTKATHVNSTPATDGEYVVASFHSQGLFCYDLDGEQKWKVDLGDLDCGPWNSTDLQWGFASSPIIADGKVIIQADVKQDPYLAAFDVATGKEVWRTARDDVNGWSTPTAYAAPDGMQILVNGSKHMGAYRLEDGEELWRMAGGGGIPVPTPVVVDEIVYLTSNHRPLKSSHPNSPIFAVETSARGRLREPTQDRADDNVLWMASRFGTYMQTPLIYQGIAYFCRDNGSLAAFDSATGEHLGRKRIGDGGTGFSASPVAAGGNIYFTSEQGEIHVFEAGDLEAVAVNTMDEVCMATPAIASGMLIFRTRGHVVAIAEK